MISRRDFLKISAAGTAASFLAGQARFTKRAFAAQSPQIPIPGSVIPQFVDPVPNLLAPESLIVDGGTQIDLEMREHQVMALPANAIPCYLGTYVWSYLQPGQTTRTSYLGPVIMATRNSPTQFKFINLLGQSATTKVLAYKYGTDQTLHWADPLNGEANQGAMDSIMNPGMLPMPHPLAAHACLCRLVPGIPRPRPEDNTGRVSTNPPGIATGTSNPQKRLAMKKWRNLIAVVLLSLPIVAGCTSPKPAAAPTPFPSAAPVFPPGSFVRGDWSWEFQADGSFVTSGPLGSETGTYAAHGDRVVITCQCCGDVQGIYTWSSDGETLRSARSTTPAPAAGRCWTGEHMVPAGRLARTPPSPRRSQTDARRHGAAGIRFP